MLKSGKKATENVSAKKDDISQEKISQEQSKDDNNSQFQVEETTPLIVSETVEPETPKQDYFWKNWGRKHLVAIIILLAQTVVILAFSAKLDDGEKWIVDKLSAFNSPPTGNNRVEVVDIQDEDRNILFKGQNDPLDPQKLYEIVQAIAKNEPRIIGIDIVTSHEQFESLELKESNIPIVWAETPVFDENDRLIGTHDPVGGKTLPNGHFSGIPVSPKDSDNTQRFYQRFVPVDEEKGVSFAFKIKSLINSEIEQSELSDTDLRYISFVNEKQEAFRPHLSAIELLEKTEKGDPALNQLLKDKIVLLGGSFSGQDQTETPVGKMLGIDVQATIIETELDGGGRKPFNIVIKTIFVIVTAIGLLLIFHWFESMKDAILASLLIIAVVTILVSIFLQDLSGTVILLGAFLLALIAQIVDKMRDRFKETVPAFEFKKKIETRRFTIFLEILFE